jgi:hypothetical protein
VDLADSEVGARVDGTSVGKVSRGGKELTAVVIADSTGDLVGKVGHLLAGLQIGLGIDPVDVPGIESDEAAGRVEDVDDGRNTAIGVPHRIGEDGGQPLVPGEASKARRLGECTGATGVHQLDNEIVGRHDRAPVREVQVGEVGSTSGEGTSDVGVRAKEYDGISWHVLGEQLGCRHWFAALPREMSC